MRVALAIIVLSFGALAQPAPKKSAAPPKAAAAPPKAAAAPPKATATTTAKSYKDLKYKPLKEIKLPEITQVTLSNGMKVYLLENHELPLVRGTARIRMGNVFEPAEKAGLSDVFGEVLRSGGTKKRTPDEVNELLEGIAASVESDVTETMGTVTFSALKEHTDIVLGVLQEFLTEPAFREEKLEVAINQYRSVIARRNDNAGGIASREFERLLFGPTTAWGRQMELDTLEKIKQSDLVAYHQRYFWPANILLSVTGDFAAAEMKDKLEKLFSGWKVKQPAVPPYPAVTHQAKPGIYVAEKDDVTQAFFRIGHLGGKYIDKDYPALEVMADILGGGGFTSRLMKKLRSDLGLTYGVSANWHANYIRPGTFLIGGSTKSQSTVESLKVIREEIDRIRTSEVSDEELQVAKDSTLNSFVFNFDSPAKTLVRLLTYEYYGYPKDFLFQYQKAIAAVTKADVLRVAKQYLKPEEFVIVAVGKPADFGTPLSALGLPMHKIDLTAGAPKKEAAFADAASLAKGKQLMEGLQKAVGGADKLAAVKDYMHTAEVTVLAMQGGLKVSQVTRVLGSQVRFEQQLPFGKIIVYADGKGDGFMVGPQGVAAIPPPALKQAGEELFRLYPTLWLSDRNPDRTVNGAGANAVEISDKKDNWIRLTMNPATGLISKVNYRAPDMTGAMTEAEAVYDDWKDVNGLKLPHKMKISQGGKAAAEITVTEYKLNSGLKPEELSKKP